jgi:hypothetical protein
MMGVPLSDALLKIASRRVLIFMPCVRTSDETAPNDDSIRCHLVVSDKFRKR